jgi:hypothetical protein
MTIIWKMLSLGIAILFLASSSAFSLPTLSMGDHQIKFDNYEMLSEFEEGSGLATGTGEDNWGVFDVSTWENEDTGDIIYTRTGPGDSEITGVFWGLEIDDVISDGSGGFTFNLNTGQGPNGSPAGLALYYDDKTDPGFVEFNELINGPTARTGDKTHTGSSEGTLLFEAIFVPGITTDSETVVQGSLDSLTFPPTGNADGYFDIVDGGEWADFFNTDTFTTALGTTADGFLSNRFEPDDDSNWDLVSDDPAKLYGVPEPGTMLLFGTGLLGFAFLGRRKIMKK